MSDAIEKVAKAICRAYAVDFDRPDPDRYTEEAWRSFTDEAEAAILVLADSVTDEMVGAFKNKFEPYTDLSGFNYRAALAAALRAAADGAKG